ncbi:carotenoid ester lipase precursor [Dichomitus squalens LYAD-421 SS1]|uniref:Carboxylic ester hydrolase n=2 Tax=Dichomitus squalens TaxID=114155 RepID=A0A4V2JYZ4_9APHY|nr:carotenoid ester lipase precursor [Dichomitus squalens LYAD-421 SS1]EJF60948.1 carotenoid ester lipase precursor [Dichomitus squalens LYAD-421 SS1]TBU23053.1 carotenoid ester lipase precursor [Dichomitus squalens]
MFVRRSCLLAALVGAALAVPMTKRASPSIQLDEGTFVGTSDGVVDKYLGIPFAKPPTGNLRFNLPVAVDPYNGTHQVTAFGPACPQQAITIPDPEGLPEDALNFIVNSIYQIISPSAEDCLSINVVVPAGTKPDAKLPVAVWIFEGGFEIGGTSTYDGGVIVQRSIELGEPVVYVSMNYRLAAFGFLASQEVKDAGVGNLGLQDQRLALRWIQKYISAFGGDPSKVTIWGESAGAISAALHLVTNGGDTEGLFRGAFMESGSPIPVGDITHGQGDYDGIVAATGCSGASDTLQCLREVDFDTLKAAVDNTPGIFSYQSLRLAWLPRADGVFLTDAPQKLVQQGSVANVPFITGDCDDEGTLFSLSNLNITNESQLRTYIKTNYIVNISESDLDTLLKLYPADVTKGSPFDTSVLNALTPEYKRIAALQGDLVFQAPRRFFLQNVAGKQPTWSFLNKRLKDLAVLGSAHATDILNVYGGGDMTDYLVNFVNHLDPNGKTGIAWPQYSVDSPKLLTFLDGLIPLTITSDDYRADGFNLITNLSLQFPI